MLFGESDLLPVALRCCGWVGRFPVQIYLGSWSGLGIQPRCEAPPDFRVKHRHDAMISIGRVKLPPR